MTDLETDAEQLREIQRLNAHINKLDAEVARLRAMTPDWFYEIEAWGNHQAVERDVPLITALGAKIERLSAEVERLRAALRDALAMVEAFASGPGMSHAGHAEFDRLTALAGTAPKIVQEQDVEDLM